MISGRSVEVKVALRGARLAGPPAKVLTALATLYSLTPSRLLPTPGAPPSLCPGPGARPRRSSLPRLGTVKGDVEITE